MDKKKKIILASAGAVCTAAVVLLICFTAKKNEKPEIIVSSDSGNEKTKIVTEAGEELVDESAFPEDADILVADFATGGEPKEITVKSEEHHAEKPQKEEKEKTNKSTPGTSMSNKEREIKETPSNDLGKKSPEYIPPKGGENPFEDETEAEINTFSADEYNSGEGCGEGIRF